jgi:DNA replication protein DnaC
MTTSMTTNPAPNPAELHRRAQALHLPGLLAHWDEAARAGWLPTLLGWEEDERARRSLQRRERRAALGAFKPMADFDWDWPTQCDRAAIEEMLALSFMAETANAILIGSNGIGKTMIARNIAHQALRAGHTVRFVSAGALLGELSSFDSASALQRRLHHYAGFELLCIDEVGYLSYSNRHADLLFELTNRRYENKSTLITTNRVFSQWQEVFPNAACVVSLVDRIIHNAEITVLEGESYRKNEAEQRAAQRQKRRAKKRP